MANICFYFQLHQPFRLKPYTFYQIGNDHFYDAVDANYFYLNRVADRCYLPMNRRMLDLAAKYGEDFKVTMSLSGALMEQLEIFRPDVLESFRQLADTGCVEFLAETYYHSLSVLNSEEEFARQVEMQVAKLKDVIGYEPIAFRNTELFYSDAIAACVSKLGFKTMLCEGLKWKFDDQFPAQVYQSPGKDAVKLLMRNSQLSDDIAFRFTDKEWSEYPLLAPQYAKWLNIMSEEEDAETILIGMDYETFGEHRVAESGIMQFFSYLPPAILANENLKMLTVSEAAALQTAPETYKQPELSTWADEKRDPSGWTGTRMQQDAISKLFALEPYLKKINDTRLWHTFGKLQTSDHFYYMSTIYWGDGVREMFSPYKSPYDAYINYMNVLSDFSQVVARRAH